MSWPNGKQYQGNWKNDEPDDELLHEESWARFFHLRIGEERHLCVVEVTNLIFLVQRGRESNVETLRTNPHYITMHSKVVIVGAGCAGLTAAIYAGRAELQPLVFAGSLQDKGGLLTKTSIVENYPGFPEGIMGSDLIDRLEEQAGKCGARMLNKEVAKADFSVRPFSLMDDEGQTHTADAIILATGSKPNKLGLPREEELWSRGISSCAVCDGALYKRKKIVVVGGGDSALEEANFLTKFSRVTLIHRRDSFRASKAMQSKVLSNEKIDIVYDTEVVELRGKEVLESIAVRNVKTGQRQEMAVDGLFYGLGLKPNVQLAGQLDLDCDGYVKRAGHHLETMTSVEGVFVAGDCQDKHYRQAIVAAGDGCKAAMDAEHYLSSK